jgi:hypothetical protein
VGRCGCSFIHVPTVGQLRYPPAPNVNPPPQQEASTRSRRIASPQTSALSSFTAINTPRVLARTARAHQPFISRALASFPLLHHSQPHYLHPSGCFLRLLDRPFPHLITHSIPQVHQNPWKPSRHMARLPAVRLAVILRPPALPVRD